MKQQRSRPSRTTAQSPKALNSEDTAPIRARSTPAAATLPMLALAVAGGVGVCMYAKSSLPLVITTLIQSALLLSAWLAAAAGWGIHPMQWLARRPAIMANGSPHRAVWAASVVGMGLGILGLLTLLLGLAGLTGATVAWSEVGLGLALGATHLHRKRAAGPPAAASDNGRYWHWFWLLAAPMLALVLIAAVVPPGLLWKPSEPHGFDVVEYHFQVPREWLEAGRIVPLRHNVFSFFPFAVEMHFMLAMELQGGPWAGAYTAQLMHAAFVALAVLATYGLARDLGGSRGSATVAAFAMATTPLVLQLSAIGFNEGGLLLWGTLSVAWLVNEVRRKTQTSESRHVFVIAGLMAGLACGAKLTAGPLVLMAVPVALVISGGKGRLRRNLVGAAWYVAIGLVVFSPWPIRNLAWVGNPVFPEATDVFGAAHFTPDQVVRWKIAHAPRPEQQSPTARVGAFVSQVVMGPSYSLDRSLPDAGTFRLPHLLLFSGMVSMAVQIRRPEARWLLMLLGMHVLFWLGFTHLQGRFFVPAYPLLAAALALPNLQRLRWALPAAATVVAAWGLAAWFALHVHLSWKLYREAAPSPDVMGGLVGVNRLASEEMGWIADVRMSPDERRPQFRFPVEDPTARLMLVGEAEAFYYPMPMSRLQYRTPFDVRGGPTADLLSAYGVERRGANDWLLLSPEELQRFEATYARFPKLPGELRPTNVPRSVLIGPDGER